MKVKIIAGLVGGAVAILALIFVRSYLPVVLLALVSAIAAYELLKSLKVKSKSLITLTVTTAAAMPFLAALFSVLMRPEVQRFLPMAVMVFLLSFFFIMLSKFKKITWTHVFVAIAGSTLIPLAISSLVFIRDFVPFLDGELHTPTDNWTRFWLLLGMFCCWLTDSFAYLTGMATGGKHKMSPTISPNKSWEGAIGGVTLCALFNLGLWFVFNKLDLFGEIVPQWWLILAISPVLSVLGILGDLTFSAVKRQTGIKDFGSLMPEHGGALDRFDSYLFVMPTLWAVLHLVYK